MIRKSMIKQALCILSVAALLLMKDEVYGEPIREPQASPDIPENINLMQRYGWTPLHWAARHGQVSTVKRLLQEGAAIDAREHMGRTPLHVAAMGNHRDTVELLIARGAEINARDRWNVTPLRRMDLLQEVRGWDRSDIKSLLTDSGGVR